jgi:DNA-binding MarR family transcriptional regulator
MKVTNADVIDTVFGLVEAVRKMFVRVDAIWEDVGISPPEAAVLERLFILNEGRARSGDLLGFPIRSTPALGKVLANLESAGMVTRQRGTEDRRAVYVQGTPQARALFDQVLERILTEVVLPTTSGFTKRDFATLRKLSDRLSPPEPSRTSQAT